MTPERKDYKSYITGMGINPINPDFKKDNY